MSASLLAVAASESEEMLLLFSAASYAVAACGPSPEIAISAHGAIPPAGSPIVVTLPQPLTFDGGGSSKVYSTDALGRVTLPVGAFRAGAVARAGTIRAELDGVTAQAALETASYTVAKRVNLSTGSDISYSGVAPDATVIGGYAGFGGRAWATYLGPTGDLYFENNRVATGVTSVMYFQDSANSSRDTLVYMAGGKAITQVFSGQGSTSTTTPDIPAESAVVGLNAFLHPDGTLVYNRAVVARGVTSVGYDQGTSSGRDYLTYVADGIGYVHFAGKSYRVENLPTDVRVIGSDDGIGGYSFLTFITPSGDLYWGASENTFTVNNAIRVATGVTSTSYTQGQGSGDEWLTYISSGAGYLVRGNPLITESSKHERLLDLAPGSTAVDWKTFITPSGDLIHGSTTLRRNVVSAGYHQGTWSGDDHLTYTQAAACPL